MASFVMYFALQTGNSAFVLPMQPPSWTRYVNLIEQIPVVDKSD